MEVPLLCVPFLDGLLNGPLEGQGLTRQLLTSLTLLLTSASNLKIIVITGIGKLLSLMTFWRVYFSEYLLPSFI